MLHKYMATISSNETYLRDWSIQNQLICIKHYRVFVHSYYSIQYIIQKLFYTIYSEFKSGSTCVELLSYNSVQVVSVSSLKLICTKQCVLSFQFLTNNLSGHALSPKPVPSKLTQPSPQLFGGKYVCDIRTKIRMGREFEHH